MHKGEMTAISLCQGRCGLFRRTSMVVPVTTVKECPKNASQTVKGCQRLQPQVVSGGEQCGGKCSARHFLGVFFILKSKYKRWREELPALQKQ